MRLRGAVYDQVKSAQFDAHMAITTAVRSGRMKAAKGRRCYYCGWPKVATEYHHNKGYSKKYRLTVVPTCGVCHRRHHS